MALKNGFWLTKPPKISKKSKQKQKQTIINEQSNDFRSIQSNNKQQQQQTYPLSKDFCMNQHFLDEHHSLF